VRATAEDGFTLIELLVSMLILLIVVASLASVLVSATHSEVDANNRFQAQEQARTGLTFLTRELHCASSVAVINTSGTALSAGTAGAGITETIPSSCATSGGQTLYVTWCTAASTLNTSDWALYRATSTSSQPTCTASGRVKWADYLTTSTPFCMPTALTACGGVTKPTVALSTVATAPSPASSGTSLTVASGQGSRFPTPPFDVTVWPAGAQPTASNAEIVLVTAVSTDTFTITRAQQGSTARSILVGDQVSAATLPILHVSFPVNLKGPTATTDTYNVVDDIVLQNGGRS
jgi:prepilin-type N-terminal cleavage/methylation domain-containing protein